ncbi:MAG: hypothetical protein AAFS00_00845 [Bacteroidota bacterium]
MLGILLIYFIGKYFFDLAEDHDKSRWGFAILGIVVYYVGTFLGGIILGVVFLIFDWGNIEEWNDIVLSLMAMPFGIGSCVGLYFILKSIWEKKASQTLDMIDAIGDEDAAKT